ncbi:hypothetical protein OROHE_019819 [Orobanche hederae]
MVVLWWKEDGGGSRVMERNSIRDLNYTYWLIERFSRANRVEPDSIAATNVEGKRELGSGRSSGPLLSGTTYCISSCSMILLNKIVLSSYACDAGISLMLYQSHWRS